MKKEPSPVDLTGLKGNEMPQRDLWPGILNAIQAGETVTPRRVKDSFFKEPVAVFAALAAALVIGIALGSADYFHKNRVPEYIRTVNDEYKTVEQLVLFNLDNSGLQGDVTEKVKANLKTIDDAVNDIVRLLEEEPHSTDLKYRLYELNRKRFEFLSSISDLLDPETKPDAGGAI